jgi:hypothetical protein
MLLCIGLFLDLVGFVFFAFLFIQSNIFILIMLNFSGVWGLGFGVWGLGFGVWGLVIGFWAF